MSAHEGERHDGWWGTGMFFVLALWCIYVRLSDDFRLDRLEERLDSLAAVQDSAR